MTLPVLVFDYNSHSNLADNIWNAQMEGHPEELTYAGPDLTVRRQTRSAAMHYDDGGYVGEIPHILSRDEYPFACSREGGGSAFVGHIPGRENSAQGGLVASFLVRNDIKPGMRFEVRVINHPQGDVKTLKLQIKLMKARAELQKLERSIAMEKGLHETLLRQSSPNPLQTAAFVASMLNPVTAAGAFVNPANRPVLGAAVGMFSPVSRPELSIWKKAEDNARAANVALAGGDPVGAAAAIAIGQGHFLNANAQFQAWRDKIPLAGRRAELAIGAVAIAASIVAIGIFAIEATAAAGATRAAGAAAAGNTSTGVRVATEIERGVRIVVSAETLAEEQAGEEIVRRVMTAGR